MRNDYPDCNAQPRSIQVLDRGYMDSHHEGLMYTSPDQKKSFLGLSNFKIEEHIEAQMCQEYGRVLFYAEPAN